MSKGVKNLILGFTLVSVIILVVFIVELIMVNRNAGDNAEGRPAATESAPAETEKSSDSASLSATDDNPAPEEKEEERLSSASPRAPTGKQCKLEYSVSESLILYYDEDLFKHNSELEMADEFTYLDGGTASLMILFKALPMGADKTAESILDGYLDGNEANVGGEGQIRNSSLRGEYVIGVNNGETFEAWVHPVSDYIGRVFLVRYSDNEQKNALYAILDTLELVKN